MLAHTDWWFAAGVVAGSFVVTFLFSIWRGYRP